MDYKPIRIFQEASIANIRADLIPLICDGVSACVEAVGGKLLSLYACGSWVRGQMRRDSDVDLYCVLSAALTEEESGRLEQNRKALASKWKTRGLAEVEIKLLESFRPNSHLTILRRAVIQIDGCLLHGAPLGGNIFAEQPMAAIASAFIQLFMEVSSRLQVNSEHEETRNRARRTLAKLTLRCMEWVAVLKGAPLSSNMNRYLDDIAMYAPEGSKLAEQCWRLYAGHSIDEHGLSNLHRLFGQALRMLSEHGVHP